MGEGDKSDEKKIISITEKKDEFSGISKNFEGGILSVRDIVNKISHIGFFVCV